MITEKKTHPERPTLSSLEANDIAKKLWEEIRDITRNEEAWYIIHAYLECECWVNREEV